MIRRLFLIASVVLLATATAQADRFTVDTVGGTASSTRVQLKVGTLSTTLRDETITSGTDSTYTATSGKKVSVAAGTTNKVTALAGSPVGTFNGTGATMGITASFGKSGVVNSTVDIGTILKKPAKGVNASASLTLTNIDVFEARKLKVTNSTMKLGNVLRGAKVENFGSYVISTTNKTGLDTESIGRVTIAGGSVAVGTGGNVLTINPLTLAGTSVGTLSAINWAAGTASTADLALTGRLTDYVLKYAVKGVEVGVTSAETVSDTTVYKDLKVGLTANIGIASKYMKATTDMTDFGKATVLNAVVKQGEQAGGYSYVLSDGSTTTSGTTAVGSVSSVSFDYNLSSKIAKNENTALGLAANATLADAVTPVTSVTSTKGKVTVTESNLGKALYGVVGSEATIVASTAHDIDSTISMAWRSRTYNEARTTKKYTGDLPVGADMGGAKWLTSDVVKIGGLSANVVYALQMSFDNRINLALDGQTKGQLDNEWRTSFIAQLDTTSSTWEHTARASSSTGNYESLAGFLKANSDKTLDQLEGAWGVDPSATNTGTAHSWVIVRGGGSGIFAVVPEPATVVMMLSAVLGALAYGWRRLSRKSQIA